MKKLYLAYMGAASKDRLLEDHEMILVVADNEMEAKEKAIKKSKLFGKIHVDVMLKVNNVDGHRIGLEQSGEEDIENVMDYYSQNKV